MKLSCLPVSFFSDMLEGRMTVSQWAQMGAEVGLDAIDLSILFVPYQSLKDVTILRQAIETTGMRVAMVTTYPDFTHPDPLYRENELEKERQAISAAIALGAELVRITAGQAYPDVTREDGIAQVVDGFRHLAGDKQSGDIKLVYENHAKPMVWTHTDFSQPPEIFLEINNRIDNTGIGINFDTANATAFSKDPVELLNKVITSVVSIHASDTTEYGKLRPTLLGEGLTPFPALFGALKMAGWDGWICMEEASSRGKSGVESAARYVRRIWD